MAGRFEIRVQIPEGGKKKGRRRILAWEKVGRFQTTRWGRETGGCYSKRGEDSQGRTLRGGRPRDRVGIRPPLKEGCRDAEGQGS